MLRSLCAVLSLIPIACASPAGAACCRPSPAKAEKECGTGTGPHGASAAAPASTDTILVFGLGPQPQVQPAPDTLGYAYGKRWYEQNEVITVRGKRYAKFGWALGAHRLRPDARGERAIRIGEHDGVPVYGRPPLEPYPRFILVRLNAECQFQPYAEVSEVQQTAPDTAADAAAVYRAVVEHLRENGPAPRGLPVVLHSIVYPGDSGNATRTHSAGVL